MKIFALRHIMFQMHCLINVFCLVVTVMSQIFFRRSFGIFTVLAFILPVIGIWSFLLNNPKKKQKKFILLGNLSSCLALLVISQNLFRIAVRYYFGFWGGFYFLVTTLVILGIIYFILLNRSVLFFRKLTPVGYFGVWVALIFMSIVFYRAILTWLLPVNELIFLSYCLWVACITLTMITCVDLKALFFKERGEFRC